MQAAALPCLGRKAMPAAQRLPAVQRPPATNESPTCTASSGRHPARLQALHQSNHESRAGWVSQRAGAVHKGRLQPAATILQGQLGRLRPPGTRWARLLVARRPPFHTAALLQTSHPAQRSHCTQLSALPSLAQPQPCPLSLTCGRWRGAAFRARHAQSLLRPPRCG